MSNPTSGRSFRQSVDHMVDRAIAEMELEPGVCKAIKASTSVLQVTFPVKIRDRTEQGEIALNRKPTQKHKDTI
ncbi:MAG: hypothetical protein AB2813_07575 [Candidatus Sedimenticola endophacoides]